MGKKIRSTYLDYSDLGDLFNSVHEAEKQLIEEQFTNNRFSLDSDNNFVLNEEVKKSSREEELEERIDRLEKMIKDLVSENERLNRAVSMNHSYYHDPCTRNVIYSRC